MKELVFGELIVLKGQHCLRIPVEMGINTLCVEVIEGKIRKITEHTLLMEEHGCLLRQVEKHTMIFLRVTTIE